LRDLAGISLNHTWSPCRWSGGRRRSVNFLGAEAAVWDFDDGKPTLETVRAWCERSSLAYFIGTTRSHLVSKHGRVCDRFRLVMPTSTAFSDNWEIFKAQMRIMQRIFKGAADPHCKDGARYYYPCTAILYGRDTGEYIDPPPVEAAKKLVTASEKYRSTQNIKIKSGALPRNVQDFLNYGTTWKGRHVACFAAGEALALMGHTEENIISMVIGAPFARTDTDGDHMNDGEIIRNVRNGIRRAAEKTAIHQG